MAAELPPEEMMRQQALIHENKSPIIYGVGSAFTGIALILFCTRVAARRVGKAPFGADDYLSALAMICVIGTTVSACMMASYGIGRHLIYVAQDPENFVRIGKAQLVFSVFYQVAMASTKASVLAVYARVFTFNTKTIKYGVWILGVYVALWFIAGMLYIFLTCQPVSTNWGDPERCLPAFAGSIAIGSTNAFSDLAIVLLPQRIIWKLQLSVSKRLAVSFLFLIGVFSTAVSIARVPTLAAANSGQEMDNTYSSVTPIVFTVIEPCCILICSCAPMVPGVMSLLPRSSLGSLLRSYGSRFGSRFGSSNASQKPTKWTSSDGSEFTPIEGRSNASTDVRFGRNTSTESTEMFGLENPPMSHSRAYSSRV